MATEQNTPRHQAQQSDPTLSDMIEAARFAFDVVELAADAVDDVALGRDVTEADRQEFADADAAYQSMIAAVRSWPADNLTEALAKLAALDEITEVPGDPDAVRANHAAFVADVARIAGATQ